jgi:hypothetical protein
VRKKDFIFFRGGMENKGKIGKKERKGSLFHILNVNKKMETTCSDYYRRMCMVFYYKMSKVPK